MVRDRDTGRAIRGALVVAADGSSTHTDEEGRFVLSVMRSERRSIRASAALHVDATDWVDSRREASPPELAFDLAPLHPEASHVESNDAMTPGVIAPPEVGLAPGPRIEDDDPEAVLRWLRASWIEDHTSSPTWQLDAWQLDAERSTHRGAFSSGSSSGSPSGTSSGDTLPEHAYAEGATCASCHEAQATLLGAPSLVEGSGAPHAALAGGCVACHGERSADGVSMRASVESDLEATRCVGCHGERAPSVLASLATARASAEAAFALGLSRVARCGQVASRLERRDGNVVLLDARGLPLGDCDGSGAIDGSELAIGIEVLSPDLMQAAEDLLALRADRSHGAHQPALTLALSRRIERASMRALH